MLCYVMAAASALLWCPQGGEFLEVDFDETGEGEGGYAKEMSPEWFAAANHKHHHIHNHHHHPNLNPNPNPDAPIHMEVRMKKSSTKQAPKGRMPPMRMMKVRPRYQGWSGICSEQKGE